MAEKKFVVIRVDSTPTWFAGYAEDGKTKVTIHYNEAKEMTEDEAQRAKFDLQIERRGVWSVRRVLL